MRNELIAELITYQDLDYASFHKRTCPNTGDMIGVRMPTQRRLARRLCRGDFRDFLATVQNEFYEETLIEGLVIAEAAMPTAERLRYTRDFVPKIQNWAICDTFCNSFKIPTADRDLVWEFLQSYRSSTAEFEVRFFLVMAMTHFLDGQHLQEIFQEVRQNTLDAYYVEMGKAWLIAEAFVSFREPTLALLQERSLPKSVQNKAIQKIRESLRVGRDDKAMLLEFKLA